MARKSLSKKKRFDVFKRDSFKCQYCGKSSPDVVLEVDHIKPVIEGGTDDITNLITSCFDCNRGKGAKLLDDQSTLEKQRKQMEELNERRNQLEMMMEWREGLVALDEDKLEYATDKWNELTGYNLNDKGQKEAKRHLKKFDLNLLLDCIEVSCEQYLKSGEDGDYTQESVEKAWKMVPRIATNKLKGEQEPHMKDLYYIRGILRNRLHYHDPVKAIKWLKLAYEDADCSIESLKELACEVKNWSEFKEEILDVLEGEGVEY